MSRRNQPRRGKPTISRRRIRSLKHGGTHPHAIALITGLSRGGVQTIIDQNRRRR